ncbi:MULTISPECIES: murein biosynthesis integral membrane protein MurJ [Leptolyngbya]|uniref:murein biosynthesis integral membrane protein MurJ n=1 Tax=Leptolyngbya TaxID=47251 RepID=UPI000360543C|nr:murein biosynthesis integral membrane protein MurJ [Leptolyngbya boryana]MBD2371121.1 murein biosynthesis integral membrane protein MurJ [Leptolyngbya sp. FACHB-161]MBD2377589.1 murein biosynthesis integral membrane protein MurJ [Leptolyngbya sp. FACHB-238]MBD2402042.1 murein biosynthesis integral membrane protein MurJ [Leptolyngbya sp. FACHB-239]MBD2408561.1 murein biosynthesis integral membrane protein MurJ [Leptolyngbya sp. FACHB-402]BAS60465.1 Proposed peptidoglycan lipid II flippase Mu
MTETSKSKRSLTRIAGIVAIATLISKVFGLVRQVAIAAAFGAGAAAGAYNFAYVIPGFLFVLLGGINGPFHSAIVSVLAKRKREEIAPVIETISTIVGGLLLLLTIGIIVFAEPLMHLTAPGLFISPAEATAKGLTPERLQVLQQTRDIAIVQLKIMAPMALLSGLIGIGFGTLNAADQYWLPSISPLLSSSALIVGLGGLTLVLGANILKPEYAMLGGEVLAWGTLSGAILQWLIQLPAQWKSGLGGLRLRFDFRRPEVKEVLRVMGPATFSSGMLQINVWTDLFFASFLKNAEAAVSAMGYAGLLMQTPLGILSNVILVPLLPIFSRLAAPENWDELKQRIRQGLLLTAVAMLPLSALMVALAQPIVSIIYERYAFNQSDVQLTAIILMAYSVGMFVYLGRDVLVRVFYALGDGDTPFRISIVNIFLNAVFDYLLINLLGAPGLILATVCVNLISMIVLMVFLDRRLNGLPWREWSLPILGLTIASGISGAAAWGSANFIQRFLGPASFLTHLIQLSVAGLIGLIIFALIAIQLKLPEVNLFANRLRQRIFRR